MSDQDFADVEIRIFARQYEDEERIYPVEITLNGQQEYSRKYISEDSIPWVPIGKPKEDGQKLFEWLFPPGSELREHWKEICTSDNIPRRIRLRIDRNAPELHALPWELLHDSQSNLAANANTPFSRYLAVALPWGKAVTERPIRVLAVISNPLNLEDYKLPPLNVDSECSILTQAFGGLENAQIQLDFLEPPVTLTRLANKLSEGYHILHYLGHGAYSKRQGQAALYLQDEKGNVQTVSTEELTEMLTRQQIRPRLIFLAACQSAATDSDTSHTPNTFQSTRDAFLGLGPTLVNVGIPAVVAMQDYVTIQSAQQLSEAFYAQLAKDGRVDLAMNKARSVLIEAMRPDSGVPVLFMRLKSGELWSDEADVRGKVLSPGEPQDFWSTLLPIIRGKNCIPIIGPRVHGKWLPSPTEIAERLANAHHYPFSDRSDLAKIAQFIATSGGEAFLRDEYINVSKEWLVEQLPEDLRPEDLGEFDTLTSLIQKLNWKEMIAGNPNEVHRVLARLNLPLYLTTNPDSFMVEALQAQKRDGKAIRDFCRWNAGLDELTPQTPVSTDYKPTSKSPMVYHLFGSDEYVDSLVLTEEHYLDFLTNILINRSQAKTVDSKDRIPSYVWGNLSMKGLLFIGYNLYDWEFRILMRTLVPLQPKKDYKRVAVQLENATDENAARRFLQKYFGKANIDVFWGSPAQFAAELREHLDKGEV